LAAKPPPSNTLEASLPALFIAVPALIFQAKLAFFTGKARFNFERFQPAH
jgi:hypothetical protein